MKGFDAFAGGVKSGGAARDAGAPLARGGRASGPLRFMKGFDAFAGVIKSGGKTRRAAKMVMLDIDHPDIEDFIKCKETEERKAWALIDAGFNGSFNVPGGAYDSIAYQNANHSVRVSDDFMKAVLNDGDWTTRGRISGQPMGTYKARHLMKQISEAAWVCGDPGVQYDTTINDWHTCAKTDRIRASNPCRAYMFLDDTPRHLAARNLLGFHAAQRRAHAPPCPPRQAPRRLGHVPRRRGLQPGVAQPDALLRRRPRLRRGELPARL